MNTFYVYVLKCSDGSFYTGHTDNLEKRIGEHSSGETGGYTSNRLPVTLVFLSSFGSRNEALVAERQIKNWSRTKKKALIKGNWKELRHLAQKTKN